MTFEIMTGKTPVQLQAPAGIYAPLQDALCNAKEGDWLSVWVDDDRANSVRSSLTTGNAGEGMKRLQAEGWLCRTAIRRHRHDPENIPEGRALVFFSKVRNRKA